MSVAAGPEVAPDRSLVARGLTRASSVRFLDESGVLLGVLLVALLFAALIGS